ncbi:uncharacterized protein LOC127832030 [Dreissena polymorpha]|uniref:Uncharacterized protein n=1 Tax=Dreissena polymorpha TaxID=45954 RepID=A0A9D4H4W1_DREPO|nr:uncharacterized protein LOC127832030 [Dreissena polymorpha]KAH3828327.1 hypothetical protein DPMN_130282 [Dreissena polymorpha]
MGGNDNASETTTDLIGVSNVSTPFTTPSTEATVSLPTTAEINTEAAPETSAFIAPEYLTTQQTEVTTVEVVPDSSEPTEVTTTPETKATSVEVVPISSETTSDESSKSVTSDTTLPTSGLTELPTAEITIKSSSSYVSTSEISSVETITFPDTMSTEEHGSVTSEISTTAHTALITDTSGSVTTVTCEKTCIGVVIGLSAGVIVLVILISLLCYYRHRKRWIQKIKAEQSKADLWAVSACGNGLGNTIVNDSFMDFRLASPAPQTGQESSASQFHRGGSKACNPAPDIFTFDSETLRRNTFSAPENIITARMQVMLNSDEHARTMSDYRGRGRTVAAGRKPKGRLDEHVLLSHEEIFDDNIDPNILRDQGVSSFTTEL